MLNYEPDLTFYLQLIIHVPFVENVRIKSVLLKLGRGEAAPRHLRIYANHSTIVDFAEAETTKPQLNISLLEGETGVVEYPVRVASFVSVHSLSLFFVSTPSYPGHFAYLTADMLAEQFCRG